MAAPHESSVNFAQALVTLVASAIGTLLAGYFGVVFAVRKLRHERSFDRTLEWYEKTYVTASRVISAFVDSLHFLDKGQPVPDEIEKRIRSGLDELAEVGPLSELYADSGTNKLLIRALEEIGKVAFSHRPQNLAESQHEASLARSMIKALGEFRSALMSEGRLHLGKTPLSSAEKATARKRVKS